MRRQYISSADLKTELAQLVVARVPATRAPHDIDRGGVADVAQRFERGPVHRRLGRCRLRSCCILPGSMRSSSPDTICSHKGRSHCSISAIVELGVGAQGAALQRRRARVAGTWPETHAPRASPGCSSESDSRHGRRGDRRPRRRGGRSAGSTGARPSLHPARFAAAEGVDDAPFHVGVPDVFVRVDEHVAVFVAWAVGEAEGGDHRDARVIAEEQVPGGLGVFLQLPPGRSGSARSGRFAVT